MRRLSPVVLPLMLAACSGAEPPPATGAPVAAAPAAAGPVAAMPLTIAEVQGIGPRSGQLGSRVRVEGVIVGNFANGLDGLFIQSLAADADPRTAEGLWLVRAGDAQPSVRTGDHVSATGTVAEIGDEGATLTALTDVQVEVLGRGEIAPTLLEAPPADWEAYEGMRVHIDVPLEVVGVDNLGRFGELMVAFGGPVYAPTEREAPNAAHAVAADNARRLLRLDDNRSRQNPDDLWFLPQKPGDSAPTRVGSRLSGVDGIVDQRFGTWRLQLTEKIGAVSQAQRPPAPTVAGDLRIAGFNVLNLFNGDGRGGGFPTERGARSRAEYERQQAKLVAVVQGLDPDIAALMEMENDGYGPESSLAQFVAALNAAGPHDDWRFVDAGDGPGTNPIRVALIYRGSRVAEVGTPATIVDGPFADHSRAPLLQAFRAGEGPVFAIAANHFKSKGGCDRAGDGDIDNGDRQGCWNATRVASARRLTEWLGTDPTASRPAGTLLIGDFNAYAEEDPLRLLRSFGWQDAFAAEAGAAEPPYSFVFEGQRGRLDHALLDAGLASRLRGAAHWHNNAEEADLFDYRREHAGAPTPWRASDHDPVLLGFDLAGPTL